MARTLLPVLKTKALATLFNFFLLPHDRYPRNGRKKNSSRVLFVMEETAALLLITAHPVPPPFSPPLSQPPGGYRGLWQQPNGTLFSYVYSRARNTLMAALCSPQ